MKPTLGRIVHVLVDPKANNGSDVAPAMITRVFSESERRWTVNLRVVLDAAPGNGYEWATSRFLYETEEEARAAENSSAVHFSVVRQHAFWPSREG